VPPAVSVIVNVPLPDVVKVVLPQPEVEMEPSAAADHPGKYTSMVSPISIAAFSKNAKETLDAVSVIGVETVKPLVINRVGKAVEVAMMVVLISVSVAIVADVVRVTRFAVCATTLVVIPFTTVRVQVEAAARVALANVTVSVAVLVPVLESTTEKVVAPQPEVVGVVTPAKLKPGSTIVIESPGANAVFTENVKATEATAAVCPGLMTRSVERNLVKSSGDNGIALLLIVPLAPTNGLICTVRVFRFAAWAIALVVIPAAILMVHT